MAENEREPGFYGFEIAHAAAAEPSRHDLQEQVADLRAKLESDKERLAELLKRALTAEEALRNTAAELAILKVERRRLLRLSRTKAGA